MYRRHGFHKSPGRVVLPRQPVEYSRALVTFSERRRASPREPAGQSRPASAVGLDDGRYLVDDRKAAEMMPRR